MVILLLVQLSLSLAVAACTTVILQQNVTCALQERKWPQCETQKCARFVVDNYFTEDDITTLHQVANKGFSTRKSVGGPSILDINVGYIRDSQGMENLFARDGAAIYSPEDFTHYGSIIRRLKQLVMDSFGISDLYFTAPTFITRLDGSEGWSPTEIHDEYWHVHADRNSTPHYHYSGLLYMSTYEADFTGGLLHFVSRDDFEVIEETVIPKAGRAVIFSSGPENPHFVDRVTSGQRFVLAFWFSCDSEKQFEIFLDGKAHTRFSHRIKSALKQREEKSEL